METLGTGTVTGYQWSGVYVVVNFNGCSRMYVNDKDYQIGDLVDMNALVEETNKNPVTQNFKKQR